LNRGMEGYGPQQLRAAAAFVGCWLNVQLPFSRIRNPRN